MKLVHSLYHLDTAIIRLLKKIQEPLARLALFIVFGWFGILKVVGASPASPLVQALLKQTLAFISPSLFLVLFGLFEILIGGLFLFRGAERVAIALLIPHMVTTVMPLIVLPSITWKGFLVPTLEGQYIIKNLVIVALAFSIAAHLHPWKEK